MIDLKELTTKYPECLKNADKLRSYLADLYPAREDKEYAAVLTEELACGIVSEIRSGKTGTGDIKRYCREMEKKRLYSAKLIRESIDNWVNAFSSGTSKTEKPQKTSPDTLAATDKMHVHTFVETVVAPTCLEQGYTLHKCACGYEHRDKFTPIGDHRFKLINEVRPTCTQEGKKEYSCTVCSEYKAEKLPVVPHIFGNWKTLTEPTCEESGLKERKCNNCVKTETQTLPRLGHNWSDWSVQTFATCEENGTEVCQCSRCNKKEERTIPALGHEYTEWQKSPTQEGLYERFCRNCGDRQYQSQEEWDKQVEAAQKAQKRVVNRKKRRAWILSAVLLSLLVIIAVIHDAQCNKKASQALDQSLYGTANAYYQRLWVKSAEARDNITFCEQHMGKYFYISEGGIYSVFENGIAAEGECKIGQDADSAFECGQDSRYLYISFAGRYGKLRFRSVYVVDMVSGNKVGALEIPNAARGYKIVGFHLVNDKVVAEVKYIRGGVFAKNSEYYLLDGDSISEFNAEEIQRNYMKSPAYEDTLSLHEWTFTKTYGGKEDVFETSGDHGRIRNKKEIGTVVACYLPENN